MHKTWEARMIRKLLYSMVVFSLLMTTAGCVSSRLFVKKEYDDGYLRGFKEGSKYNLDRYKYDDVGGLPYKYWTKPMVQRIYIPPRIVGGCMVPGHYEYVTIVPGQWRTHFAYPIGEGGLKPELVLPELVSPEQKEKGVRDVDNAIKSLYGVGSQSDDVDLWYNDDHKRGKSDNKSDRKQPGDKEISKD